MTGRLRSAIGFRPTTRETLSRSPSGGRLPRSSGFSIALLGSGRFTPRPCAIISRLRSEVPSTTNHAPNCTLLLILPALLLSACAHRYRVQGLVLDVNRNDRTMIVSHRAIPGYMDAMAMPFRVRTASELDSVKRGDQVEFQLVVKRRTSLAEKVKAGTSAEVANARRGEAPLPLPIPAEKLALGMPVPDFQLMNQSAPPGSFVRFCRSNRRGEFHLHALPAAGSLSAIVGQFCASAEAIPRANGKGSCSSVHYAGLSVRQRGCIGRLCEAVGRRETDGIFLTGDSADIQRLASQLGLVYWPEDGLLTHTSQTGIISRDGRLSALIEGSSYEEDQLGDLIARQLEVSHDSNRHSSGFCSLARRSLALHLRSPRPPIFVRHLRAACRRHCRPN